MKTRQEIEDRINLFMTNIRKGLSYDANVVLLTNDIEEAESNALYKVLCTLRDGLNDEIIKINSTTLKNDFGTLDVQADPMQLKSFARGFNLGLIIARDRIEKALIEYSA